MYQNDKIGICVECGPLELSEEYTDFAIQTAYQFLNYFDMTNKLIPVSAKRKRLVKAVKAINKTSPSFALAPGLYDFQKLTSGQVLATDGEDEFTAQSGECIIFPHYAARVGEEAYIIGQEIDGE
jgi:succinylglutamate desuccinylase